MRSVKSEFDYNKKKQFTGILNIDQKQNFSKKNLDSTDQTSTIKK